MHQPVISLIESGGREATPAVRQALVAALAVRPSHVVPLLRERIIEIIERNGGSRPRIFGSVARGTDDTGSDIDLLVHFEAGRDIVDLLTVEQQLSELLTFDVDVISDDSAGTVAVQALREAVPL